MCNIRAFVINKYWFFIYMMKVADFFGKKARSLLDKSFAVKISQNPRPL